MMVMVKVIMVMMIIIIILFFHLRIGITFKSFIVHTSWYTSLFFNFLAALCFILVFHLLSSSDSYWLYFCVSHLWSGHHVFVHLVTTDRSYKGSTFSRKKTGKNATWRGFVAHCASAVPWWRHVFTAAALCRRHVEGWKGFVFVFFWELERNWLSLQSSW